MGGAVALLIGVVAAGFWPGVAMYDTVTQYDQVLSNEVDDWHPPVMVRLWQLLLPLGSTTRPMFALQVGLYAVGFALIVAALARNRRPIAATATGVLAISPLLFGWQMVVLKDAQMLGALVAVVGIVAHYRLLGLRVPAAATAIIALLIIYATLVRANAVFATVPLTILLARWPSSLVARVGVGMVAVVVLLAAEPLINQRLFGADSSGVAKSQLMFDLAAIAVANPASVSPFTPSERNQMIQKHCVKAFFWDPITEPSACGPATERVDALPEHELYEDLARAAAAHPVSYLQHRLEHWNSTERWLVAPGLVEADPPDEAEPNDIGLKTPSGALVTTWQSKAASEAGTPLGWPIFWTVVGMLLFPVAWRRRGTGQGDLAIALLSSALALEASFLVISISSDLRYHLWLLAAVPLALILLSASLRPSRCDWIIVTAALVIVVGGGLFTRSTFPRAPASYSAMLHAATG